VGGILTLTGGKITTTSANLLNVTNSLASAISGGSATAYVNGPLARAIPASLATGSTYAFPVSKGGINPFELINPPTYGAASTLLYDCTCVFARSVEWSQTSGPGYPNDVTVNTDTDLDLGSTTPGTVLQTAGSAVASACGSASTSKVSKPRTLSSTTGFRIMKSVAANRL
jgi:hypothetical protein